MVGGSLAPVSRIIPAVVGATLAAAWLPLVSAQASNQAVRAEAVTFVPGVVAVNPSESVTFRNSTGLHNVVFDLGPKLNAPSEAEWTVARTFAAPGAYRYFCEVHGTRGGQGMSGIVYVNGPLPVLTGASAVGRTAGFTLSFRSSQAALLTGTLYKRLASGGYRFYGRLTGSVPAGLTRRAVSRTASGGALSAGTYKLSLRVRGARLSAPRTLLVTVR